MSNCNSDCPICGGMGWVLVGENGAAICPNLPVSYKNTGVIESDKDVPYLLEKTETLISIGKELKTLREAGFGMLWIQGGFGIGKSVLAKAATVEVLKQRKSALFVRQFEMINRLRSAFAEDNGQLLVLQRIAELCDKDWLVIDEIGRINQTQFANESMGEIINARYEQTLNQKSMTVLISNDSPEEVLEPYLADRIRDVKCKVLAVTGESLRREKEQNEP